MIPRIRVHERHVLMWLLIASMAAMAMVAIWLFWSHQASHTLAPGGAAHVHWLRPTQQPIIAEYFDPSVMSLPNPRGFSGNAWRHLAPAIQAAYKPEQPPAFLALPASAPLPVLLPEPSLGELTQTQITPTAIESESVTTATIVPVTNSIIEITGALSGRQILQSPVLPLASVPVRTTRVLIAVTGDGRVRYAVLERSSGNEVLDGAVVEIARQVWFAPEPNINPLALTWGTLRLVWAARI